jgi:hypothetical protein
MSIDYNLTVSPVVSERAALDYVAKLLGCDRRYSDPDAVARGDELRIGALRTGTEHDAEMGDLLGGETETLKIIFHPSKFLTEEADARLFAEMIGAAVRFFEDFPDAKGTFTFQGEEIYMQRLGDEGIVLDERLRGAEYNREGALDELLAKYPVRPDRPGIPLARHFGQTPSLGGALERVSGSAPSVVLQPKRFSGSRNCRKSCLVSKFVIAFRSASETADAVETLRKCTPSP